MNILGISAFYHDSAAALVRGGEIVAAAQEERFTRAKNTSDFPTNSIRWCLENSGLKGDQIDFVAFYDKPFLKFERLIETYFAFAPKGFTSFRTAMPIWISEKLFQKDLLLRELNAIDPGLRRSKQADVQRTSPQPCGLGILSLPVRGSGNPDARRCRRVERRRPPAPARAAGSTSTRRFIFHTPSACCMRHSPTIRDLRSTPTNTR